MRARNFLAITALLAAVSASGCTTTNLVDTTETTAIPPAQTDISRTDLDEGRAQFRDANYGLAEKHFRKAVELRATNAEAWMGLAASYDQLGRFDFADRAYAQLVKLAGRQPRVVSNMGYSYLLRGDLKKARAHLEEARRAMPGDPVVTANLALLDRG